MEKRKTTLLLQASDLLVVVSPPSVMLDWVKCTRDAYSADYMNLCQLNHFVRNFPLMPLSIANQVLYFTDFVNFFLSDGDWGCLFFFPKKWDAASRRSHQEWYNSASVSPNCFFSNLTQTSKLYIWRNLVLFQIAFFTFLWFVGSSRLLSAVYVFS